MFLTTYDKSDVIMSLSKPSFELLHNSGIVFLEFAYAFMSTTLHTYEVDSAGIKRTVL